MDNTESYADRLIGLNDQQVWQLMDTCRRRLGIYPLASLCRADVLAQWREVYQDIPRLNERVDDACDYVASRWEEDGLPIAWDMAVEYVDENAREDGIEPKLVDFTKEHPNEPAPQWRGFIKPE